MKGDINPAKDVVGFLRSVLEEYVCLRPQKICVFQVSALKKLGVVGWHFHFILSKYFI